MGKMKYLLLMLAFVSNSVFAFDYVILCDYNTYHKLADKVKEYINKGYKLGGFGTSNGWCYQVVYKD